MSVPPPSTRRRTLSLAFYVPLLGSLAALLLICAVLLVSGGGKPGVIRAGGFSTLFLFFLGRRALFLYKGGEPSTLRDIALPAAADILLFVILLSRLA